MNKLSFAVAALIVATPAFAHPDHQADETGTPEQVGTEYMVMETSANEAAEGQFLHGLALLHNFEYDRAAAAFRDAQAADPDFVMAYWGEAMTHNHPLWAQQDWEAAHAALARLGASLADRAAKARNAREGDWLAAVETLFGEGTKEERDRAYLAHMRGMFANDPADIDVRAFTGLAILGSSHGGRQIPIYMEAAGLLEPGFMTHEMHPGILHYLIHSYDDPVHAPLGKRMAERYAVSAPDAGHAQHMVSHIFYALADWEATEAANVRASAVVNSQRRAKGRPETSCGHYNEWLAYSLLQQGKDASELIKNCHAQVAAALKKHAASPDEEEFSVRGTWSATRVANFLGVDGNEWIEPLDLPDVPETIAARFQQAHGQLLEARNDPAIIREKLDLMMQLSSAGLTEARKRNPDREPEVPVWAVRAMARGEALHLLAQGEREQGLAMLEGAAAAELALPIEFGPPPIFKPSYEILGEELLDDGRKAEAAEAFRKSLLLAPGRWRSIAGLEVGRQ